jgi:hypothetical protein
MKERPILFSGPMVRAILAGNKTQTRRVVKTNHAGCGKSCHPAVLSITHRGGGFFGFDASEELRQQYITTFPFGTIKCPHGKPGERLWVRESWRTRREWDKISPNKLPIPADELKADPEWCRDQYITYAVADEEAEKMHGRGRPSIHMPRWASRINLEITAVRVERLQDISEADALAEGISWPDDGRPPIDLTGMSNLRIAAFKYKELWESINGAGSWAANPWVWVIEFKPK